MHKNFSEQFINALLSEVPFIKKISTMKTLLLAFIKERFYWEKNTDRNRMGWQNYMLYDNLNVCVNYFESIEKMQRFMINSLAIENVFISDYQLLLNKRNNKRMRKSRDKLQAKYASKFKRKSWWNFR